MFKFKYFFDIAVDALRPGTPGNQTLKVSAQHVFLDLVECCPMLSVVHAILKPSRNKNC